LAAKREWPLGKEGLNKGRKSLIMSGLRRPELTDSRPQSVKNVSRETLLSDWRAKPYKASDSGFAFKLVRSIDFFGTISGWRDEARRRDMGERNGATRFSERTSWTMLP
jgi:hypothetical protein